MSALRSIILLLFVICNVFYVHAQNHSRKGRLHDAMNRPVDFGSVIVGYNLSEEYKSDYYSPDSLGYFIFTVPLGASNVFLEIMAVGFEPKKMTYSKSGDGILEILLKQNEKLLEEVHVRVKRNVIQKGDTTLFNTNAFSNNNETTVEDLLKKLPGMSIDKEGNIKFNNKAIDRVMLEGDDLFDDNYKMLTKNLSAGLIEQVEVVNKFNSNAVLSGITRGEQQVINLKLKNKNKIIKEGNVNLGLGGPQWRFDNRINLLGLSSKLKVLGLGAMNNTGQNPFSFIGQDQPDYQSSKGLGLTLRAKSNPDLYKVREYYYPDIDLERNNFNNARVGSLNLLYKVSKKFQIKLNSYLVKDVNRQTLFSDVTNINGDSLVNYSQKNQQKKNRMFQGYHLEGAYKNGKSSQLIYKGDLEYSRNDISSELSIQGIPIMQEVESKKLSVLQRLQYTSKIDERHAFESEVLFSHYSNPQKNLLSRNLFDSSLPGLTGNDGIRQQSRFPLDQFSFALRLFGKNVSSDYRVNIGMELFESNFTNDIKNIKENLEGVGIQLNAYHLQNLKRYLNLYYRVNLGDQFSLMNDLNASYDWLKNVNKNTELSTTDESYANLDLGSTVAYQKKGSNASFSLQYRLSNKISSLTDLIPILYVSDYRTLTQDAGVFRKVLNHSVTLNYSYADYRGAMLLYNATLSYNTNASGYINQLNFGTLYDIVRQIPYQKLNNPLLLANGRIEKYLDLIGGNLFIEGELVRTSSYNFRNAKLSRSVVTNTKIELGFRSAWDGKLNVLVSSGLRNSNMHISSGDFRSSYLNSFIENRARFYFILNDRFNFELGGEHYGLPSEINRKHLVFIDLNSRFIISKDKFYIDFNIKNALNAKVLTFNSVSAFRSSTQQYQLLPNYAMLKFFYKF